MVQALVDAGAMALGKTNLDQFATGLVGTRSPYGACRNSFDPAYISGGSSSGSAVAVALGLASFALGTDTAGSGRVPAAFNNLIGYKPTLGTAEHARRGAGLPLARRDVDLRAHGRRCRAASRQWLREFDAAGSLVAAARLAPRARLVGSAHDSASPCRAPRNSSSSATPNTRGCSMRASSDCETLGGEAREVDIAPLLETARLLYEGPWVAERYLATEAAARPRDPEAMLRGDAPHHRRPARRRRAIDAFRAQYRLQALQRVPRRRSGQRPTCCCCPPPARTTASPKSKPIPSRCNSNLGRYTNFVNLMDLAAVAVPAGFTRAGLPFGVSLIAPAWTDADLLALAGARAARRGEHARRRLAAAAAVAPVAASRARGLRRRDGLRRAHVRPATQPAAARTRRQADRVTRTAPVYRFYALPGGPPFRPGLVQVREGGVAVDVEVWRMPLEHFGSFVAGIPAPLGIGKVRLEDGSLVSGFLCEVTRRRGRRRHQRARRLAAVPQFSNR